MESTELFLAALERHDLDTVTTLLEPDITWTLRQRSDGVPTPYVMRGREKVMARLRELDSRFERVSFTDRRISPIAGQDTTFVQTTGDFRTTDGRPYQNVYVFRFDWRDGRLASWEEYANPVVIQTLEQGNA